MCAALIVISHCASAQSQYPNRQPTEGECLGLIALLPYSAEMKAYYDKSQEASAKEIAEKLRSLADSGDKAAQFTYSNLLLTGYCVPQDFCAARTYRERSRGGDTDWEKVYPIPSYLKKKYEDATCR